MTVTLLEGGALLIKIPHLGCTLMEQDIREGGGGEEDDPARADKD